MTIRARSIRGHREAGFTLLELLVSMSVLALLSVMMVGGLSFGARVWERTESAAQDQGRVAAVQALLRRQIAQMQPQQVRGSDRRPRVAFEGSGDRLVFVAPLPYHLSQGGYYLIAVESEAAGTTRNLILRWEPFDRERPGLTLSDKAHKEILVAGVRAPAFRYLGHDRRGASTGWLTVWPDTDSLPQLVNIAVTFEEPSQESWPTFVAAVVTESVQR